MIRGSGAAEGQFRKARQTEQPHRSPSPQKRRSSLELYRAGVEATERRWSGAGAGDAEQLQPATPQPHGAEPSTPQRAGADWAVSPVTPQRAGGADWAITPPGSPEDGQLPPQLTPVELREPLIAVGLRVEDFNPSCDFIYGFENSQHMPPVAPTARYIPPVGWTKLGLRTQPIDGDESWVASWEVAYHAPPKNCRQVIVSTIRYGFDTSNGSKAASTKKELSATSDRSIYPGVPADARSVCHLTGVYCASSHELSIFPFLEPPGSVADWPACAPISLSRLAGHRARRLTDAGAPRRDGRRSGLRVSRAAWLLPEVPGD